MFTFELIMKLIISVAFTYVAINSIFHYHFTIDRITLIFSMAVVVVLVFFYDTTSYLYMIISLAVVTIFYSVAMIIAYKKKVHGYFLFNSYRRKDYTLNKAELERIMEELNVPRANLCYGNRKPFLYILRNTDYKDARKIAKEMDKFEQKQPKSINMISYWHIVALLILLVMIWRF